MVMLCGNTPPIVTAAIPARVMIARSNRGLSPATAVPQDLLQHRIHDPLLDLLTAHFIDLANC